MLGPMYIHNILYRCVSFYHYCLMNAWYFIISGTITIIRSNFIYIWC